MSKNYKLVYMLAVKDDQGHFDPLVEHGEFLSRAAAKEYVLIHQYILPGEVFLVRKEVSFFYDRKLDIGE